MNQDEALTLLRGGEDGVREWNERRENGEDLPDLPNVDLSLADLCRANLSQLDFKGARFDGADLRWADLTNSDLSNANLRDARLCWAKFVAANLRAAQIDGADLTGADLEGAVMPRASLTAAVLIGARFRRANLSGVDLRHAIIYELVPEAHLRNEPVPHDHLGTDFRGAMLCGANLRDAQVAGMSVQQADLSEADMRVKAKPSLSSTVIAWWHKRFPKRSVLPTIDPRLTTPAWLKWMPTKLQKFYWSFVYPQLRFPFKLDETRIRGTRFSPRVSDPWSVLRRKYSGHLLVYHLLFLLAFFIPYILRTLFWVGVNRAEVTALRVAVNSVQWASDRLGESTDSRAREWAEHATKFCAANDARLSEDIQRVLRKPEEIIQSMESIRALLGEAAALTASEDLSAQQWSQQAQQLLHLLRPSMKVEIQVRSVWQVLLGLDKGIGYFVMAAGLLIYNLCRGMLTYFVGALREQEERSGDSPAWREYHWLYRAHRVATVLFILAVGSFVFHVWHWLSLPILLPV